jgi:O-acetyl-ADP-ribose deacetylase (regulator of RNase III)
VWTATRDNGNHVEVMGMCDRISDGEHREHGDGLQPAAPARLVRIELRSPVAAHATIYRALLGDIAGVSIVDGPLLEGCIADAVIAPTNSFGYLDTGIDGAFARRFGRRLQRSLQERIACEFDAELPVGEAVILPSGDFTLPFVVMAPATQLPGGLSTEPMIYLALNAALRSIDAWNAADEMPPIESVIIPDIAGIAGIARGWDADRLVLQLREVLEAWRHESGRRVRRTRAA